MEARNTSRRRRQRVLFETDRHVIVGDITLPPEGYQSRFSDAINRPEVAFVPVVDVDITPLGGGETRRLEFAVVAKAHVRLAYPVEESA